jgi:hypothetical protein
MPGISVNKAGHVEGGKVCAYPFLEAPAPQEKEKDERKKVDGSFLPDEKQGTKKDPAKT